MCRFSIKTSALSIFAFFSFFFFPNIALGATLTISPSTGTVHVGEVLTAKILVSGGSVPLNAISGDVSFPSNIFNIESVLKNGSVLNFWVTEPTFSKSSGTVHFEGVSLSGFTGNNGVVVTVVLRAKREGRANASFNSGQILANDGQGTDITSGLSGATYTVIPAKITEPSSPEPAIPEIVPEEPQAAPTLLAPQIIVSKKYGEQAIVGTSDYPDSQAVITFSATNGTKLFITSKADKDGGFTILVPKVLRHGSYAVTAVMVQADGTNSPTSERIFVMVGSIFSDVDTEFYIALWLLIFIILYLLTRLGYRYKNGLPLVVRKKVKQAEDTVKESFKILREEVNRSEKKLKSIKASSSKVDTKISDLKGELDSVEDEIEKKIENIGTE